MVASIAHILSQVPCWSSDALLLERYIHQRDEDAFTALVARHGALVLRLCRRILGDAHAAEDAFQATFLILARKAHSLNQPDALPAWLYGVARRVALKARAKSARPSFETLVDTLSDPHPDPLTQLSARELLDILGDEVQRLPMEQRAAVVLCCLEGHTQEEAARMLGWTAGSLKGRLERGRQRLQTRLQRRGITLSAAIALVVMTRESIAGRVPSLLLQSTVRAALHGSIGSTASALAHSVLQAMFLPKLAGMMAVTLTIALAASTTVALVYRGPEAEAPLGKTPPSAVPPQAPRTPAPAARVDRFGDSLPEGALLRLGTIRFRTQGVIFHAALSPDGKLLATACQAGIALFDAATGKSQLLRDSIAAGFSSSDGSLLAFSPDGKQLVNVTKGGNLHFWDVATGKRLRVVGKRREPAWGEDAFPKIPPPAGGTHFSKVCFPPKGKEVIAGTADNSVLFIEPSTGKILRRFRLAGEFASIAADGKTLTAIDEKRPEAILYDDRGKELHRFRHEGNIGTASLCQRGKRLVTINDKAEIKIWSTATGKAQCTIAGPAKLTPARTPMVVAIAPDGKSLFAGLDEGDILRWDLDSGKEREPLRGHANMVSGLFFTPDGRSLISAGWDSVVRRWELPSGQAEPACDGYAYHLCIAWSPDGRTMVAASSPGRLDFWDRASGKRLRAFSLPANLITQMRFAPDGKLLALACSDARVRLWDTGKERVIRELKLPATGNIDRFGRNWYQGLAWSPDSRFLAASLVGEGGTWMWETATGKEIWHVSRGGVLAFAPDGKTLVRGGYDRSLTFQDPATGIVRFTYNHDNDFIYDLAYSPDGKVLATCHQDGIVYLRDPENGRVRKTLQTHPPVAYSVSFSTDSKWLTTSGLDGIRIWETATAREVFRLTGRAGWACQSEFSPDGRTILSAYMDLTALLWSLHPDLKHQRKRPEMLWKDLIGEPALAYRAIWELTDDPKAASEFLRKQIVPVKFDVDECRMKALLADLDSDDFNKRESASRSLAAIGKAVEDRLRRALADAKSAEVQRRIRSLLENLKHEPTPEDFRRIRAVQVMELCGTADALGVLRDWAGGTAGAPLTEQAKAALERLTRPARK